MSTDGEVDRQYQTECYEAYLQERSQLIKNEYEGYRDYDKWLITVSGSALAISMAFVKDIVPMKSAQGTAILGWAWALLLGSLVASLVSVLAGPFAHAAFRRCLDAEGEKGFCSGYWSRVRTAQGTCASSTLTQVMNILALVSFVTGMALLVAFLWVNIGRGVPDGKQVEVGSEVQWREGGAASEGTAAQATRKAEGNDKNR